MRTLFKSFRGSHGFVSLHFICGLLTTLFLPMIASAADKDPDSTLGKAPESDGSPRLSFPMPVDKLNSAPRWTFSTGAIVLGRTGGVNQTLVERVPGGVPFYATPIAPGTEAFNSSQFRQGVSAGPKVALIYHGDSGYGAELSYFNAFDQSGSKAIGPDSPPDWLVMKAPGGFWQTQDFPYQAMAWTATTSLYSAEVNGRLDLSSRVSLLAGFRWLQLNDDLLGTLTPADLTAPTWKGNPRTNLFQITPGGPAGNYPPFWNASTTNKLYGVQIGVDGNLLELGHLSLVGLMKIGIFDNHAEQSTAVTIAKVVYPSKATTSHPAFVGEVGLQLKYAVTQGLTLKAGYEALWLAGVALAPGQIQETLTSMPANVRALGVRSGSSLLFHGATAGMEYSF